MAICYEVYEKGTSWNGLNFRTREECIEYIKGRVALSKDVYTPGYTEEDFQIIPCPITVWSPEDALRDEFGDEAYEQYLANKGV